jgi:hypothetical protein
MADWSKRLQRLQAASPAPELETLEHLTLAELRGEKITFGKTHAGKTFEDVWLTYWIKWFLQHFAESGKMEHRRIIKLIKLKIEEAENHPETLQAPCLPKAKAAPKILAAKAKARPTDVSEVNMEILSAME